MQRLCGMMAAVLAFSLIGGLFCSIIGGEGEYLEAEGKDFVLVWNSGGWGRSSYQIDPDWVGIFEGMQSELAELGYTSVVVDYIRSEDNLAGLLREIMGSLTRYPLRAKELANEVNLLTESNPDCKVILVSMCNGVIYINEVMKLLRDNPRVYSIQVSWPFWYRSSVGERSLVLNDNGVRPDVLYTGDIGAIIRANFGRLPSKEKPPGGAVMIGQRFIKAPGHEYTWEHLKVRSEITSFLHDNFGSN